MPVAPSPSTSDARLTAAVESVRRSVDIEPEIALILGSGLGELADAAEDAVHVEASDIPGYPTSTVEGHHGRLVFGYLEETPVVFVQGRVHAYEGYNMRRLAFPVRLVEALGADKLLVTNSAGGIHRDFSPGTLMFITDHINFAFASPLAGSGHAPRQAVPGGHTERHLPFYDKEWTKRAKAVARSLGVATREGTYIWVQGPSYETKAEIRAFEKLGADAVGMSTVPEVIQAQHLGMSVLGLSTITNPAAGMGAESLNHEEVLEVGRQVRDDLKTLVKGIVRDA